MVAYLSGCTGGYLENGTADLYDIGLLIQPRNNYWGRLDRFPSWGADNGAFSKVHPEFDPAVFRRMLYRPQLVAARATCRFVAAPDRLVVLSSGEVVGDAEGTLAQYPDWAREIRARGLPSALVAQDGLEDLLGYVNWDLVDVLFLGGSTEWKIGPWARVCVHEAKAHGKRTHMGRVNSLRRLQIAKSWGVDSADGTFLGFGPDTNLPRLLRWLDKLETT